MDSIGKHHGASNQSAAQQGQLREAAKRFYGTPVRGQEPASKASYPLNKLIIRPTEARRTRD
jgi:hypothetical protein